MKASVPLRGRLFFCASANPKTAEWSGSTRPHAFRAHALAETAGVDADEIDQMNESQDGDKAADEHDGSGRDERRIEAIARAFFKNSHSGNDEESGHKDQESDDKLRAKHQI